MRHASAAARLHQLERASRWRRRSQAACDLNLPVRISGSTVAPGSPYPGRRIIIANPRSSTDTRIPGVERRGRIRVGGVPRSLVPGAPGVLTTWTPSRWRACRSRHAERIGANRRLAPLPDVGRSEEHVSAGCFDSRGYGADVGYRGIGGPGHTWPPYATISGVGVSPCPASFHGA